MSSTDVTVAVLGAGGTMGLPMARNWARAGFAVRAWNRTRSRIEPLADDGVCLCDSPADAVAGADVVVTIVADADAVLETIAAAQPGAGVVWAQMSTIGERGMARCLEFADGHGLVLVDAPVLGTKQPAEAGKLVVLASGPDDVRSRVEGVFDAVGTRTMWVGEAGAGTRLKVAVNTWILSVVEGAAETLALAEGLGLDPALVLDAVAGGPLDLPYLQMKGKAMIDRSFDPAFKLALAAKDAGLVEESADLHDLDLPLVRTIRARLAEGAGEHGERDMSATFLTSVRGGGGGGVA